MEERARNFATVRAPRQKPRRCPTCASRRLWWNGWRTRAAMVMRAGRAVYLPEVRYRRVRCGRCGRDWTLLPAGIVARRQFQPSVAAYGVALWARGATLEQIAAVLLCSRRSVGRWISWLGSAAPGMLRGAWRKFAGRVCALLGRAGICATRVPVVAR